MLEIWGDAPGFYNSGRYPENGAQAVSLVYKSSFYTETHSKFGFWQRESSRD